MDENKYTEKANEVLEWLKVNDAGALGPVIEATLQAGLTATTDEDRDKFWASVRSLCGTLPKSPIPSPPPARQPPSSNTHYPPPTAPNPQTQDEYTTQTTQPTT